MMIVPCFACRRSLPVTRMADAGRRRGATLLELSVAVTLLGLVFGGTLIVLLRTQEGLAESFDRLTIDQLGWRITERVSSELKEADPTSVSPVGLADSPSVRFRKVLGYDSSGSVEVSDELSFEFRAQPGEEPIGVDNDGDGLVDEGCIRFKSGGGAWIPVSSENVLDLRLSSETGGVSIEVDVAVADREGNVTQRTFGTRVTFRN